MYYFHSPSCSRKNSRTNLEKSFLLEVAPDSPALLCACLAAAQSAAAVELSAPLVEILGEQHQSFQTIVVTVVPLQGDGFCKDEWHHSKKLKLPKIQLMCYHYSK